MYPQSLTINLKSEQILNVWHQSPHNHINLFCWCVQFLFLLKVDLSEALLAIGYFTLLTFGQHLRVAVALGLGLYTRRGLLGKVVVTLS